MQTPTTPACAGVTARGFVPSSSEGQGANFRAPSAPMKFESLQRDLQAARAGTLDMGTLARRLRGLILPAALPPKYAEVLANIADRMESSALFDDESCSFSQADLLEALEVWAEKANEKLRGS